MYNYLILNVLFMIAIAIGCWTFHVRPAKKILLVSLMVMLVLTLVFDNVIIGLDIVRYDETKILGVMVGSAPIEDFAYAIVAALAMPVIWSKLKKRS